MWQMIRRHPRALIVGWVIGFVAMEIVRRVWL